MTAPDPIDLKVWKDSHEKWWVCAEYDHGPLCRLCQRIEPKTAAALEALTAELDTAKAALAVKDSHDHFDCAAAMAEKDAALADLTAERDSLRDEIACIQDAMLYDGRIDDRT